MKQDLNIYISLAFTHRVIQNLFASLLSSLVISINISPQRKKENYLITYAAVGVARKKINS